MHILGFYRPLSLRNIFYSLFAAKATPQVQDERMFPKALLIHYINFLTYIANKILYIAKIRQDYLHYYYHICTIKLSYL